VSIKWDFYPQGRDTIRNPISGEFFASESEDNAAEALVREGIQNTLDARVNRFQRASIRISFSGINDMLPPARAKHWFGTFWQHIMAPGNGLRSHPSLDEPCPYLVFEDFGTTGLSGDPTEYRKIEGVKNDFLNFFRAEGISDKGEEDRGSWGVGKIVFNRCSAIKSFLAMTIREDDRRCLLMGRSILNYHSVDGQYYKTDGYFGRFEQPDFALPCEDVGQLAEFCRDFHLKRQNESGLSIVIPWYDVSGDGGITPENVINAVLRGFFYPILMGHLDVEIDMPGRQVLLDANSITDQVQLLDQPVKDELLPYLHLAEWAGTRVESEFHSLVSPSPDGAQNWSAELVPLKLLNQIKSSLQHHQRVALRIPMYVHPKLGHPVNTSFKLFLEYSGHESEKPVFIRDELIISYVRSPRTPNVRALVIVDDKPLATLLKDAETPSHTQWTPESSNFKNKYKFGPGAIKFVRLGVSELLHIVNQAEQEPDPSITIDYFSIPAPPEDEESVPGRRRRARHKPGPGPENVPPIPPPRAKRFRIDPLNGGFRIAAGDADSEPPELLRVRVAYDVRRGNPFRKYNPADFELSENPIEIAIHNNSIEILHVENEQMRLRILKSDFGMEVTGFDPDRDIKVDARVDTAPAETTNGDYTRQLHRS
jgi:hypothetical protein